MRLLFALAVGACAVTLALVSSGCGGSDSGTSSTADWATSFCTAITDWTNELQRIRDQFDDPSSLNVDAIKEAGDDATTATDDLVQELRDLGAPETESGQAVDDAVTSLSDTLEREKTNIETEVDDVSSLTDVPGALTVIGTSLTAMGTALQTAIDAIGEADVNGELETALEESPACDEISGSSS